MLHGPVGPQKSTSSAPQVAKLSPARQESILAGLSIRCAPRAPGQGLDLFYFFRGGIGAIVIS